MEIAPAPPLEILRAAGLVIVALVCVAGLWGVVVRRWGR
jgi:hypothetical protein